MQGSERTGPCFSPWADPKTYCRCELPRWGNRPWPWPVAAGWSDHSGPCHSCEWETYIRSVNQKHKCGDSYTGLVWQRGCRYSLILWCIQWRSKIWEAKVDCLEAPLTAGISNPEDRIQTNTDTVTSIKGFCSAADTSVSDVRVSLIAPKRQHLPRSCNDIMILTSWFMCRSEVKGNQSPSLESGYL